MDKQTIDFTDELAEMLIPIADIAISIRLNSSYSISTPTQGAAENVMYLSDSLHNLNMLGETIRGKDPKWIIESCEFHLNRFQNYYPTLPGFDEHHAKRAVKHLISILNNIKNKAMENKLE